MRLSISVLAAVTLITPILARDDAAIQELMAGKRSEARAEWWGFDETDATQALQAAIQSKAKRLIIGNVGKPWNVRPIQLVSNQEIVFEKGVVVQALRGAFKSKHDMLIRGSGVKHVTLSGEGATLKMWKSDYVAAPYEKSEWRHALAFYTSEDVTIRGLTIADSGGDGIYLGGGSSGAACRKFTIKEVRCVNHHRQGISVISAEDLLIDHCVFNDTQGTAPQAGIDFEPNSPKERLKNCVLRDCNFENNTSFGVLFALNQLDVDTEPLSIRMENCRTVGNRGAVHFAERNPFGVRGSVVFDHCRFEDSRDTGVEITNKSIKGAQVTFDQCTLVNLASARATESPIVLKSGGNTTETMGGIVFKNCVIDQKEERTPLFYEDVGGARVKEITGTFTVKTGSASKQVELTQALLDQWFPWSAEMKDYARYDMKRASFEPSATSGHGPFPALQAWQRETSHYAVWGRAGEALNFTVTLKALGKAQIKAVPLRVITPSGRVVELKSPSDGEAQSYTHQTTESGIHRIVCEAGQQVVSIQSPTDVGCLMSLRGAYHFVGRAGPLHFVVPQGITEFGVKVAGGGGTERVKLTVKDASGKVMATKDNISRGEAFPLKRSDAAQAEVWSLTLEKPSDGVLEDVNLLIEGVPPFLASSPASVLMPISKP